jgi:hypothetical protein
MLTDFGVEKDAWFTPGFAGHESGDLEQGVDDLDPANLDANLLFRFNMPLPDADHSLHHATCQSLISPFFRSRSRSKSKALFGRVCHCKQDSLQTYA